MGVWITFKAHFFQVSLTNDFDLPYSESVFCITQDPPTATCLSLSQDGFRWRRLWVGWHHFPFDLQGYFLWMCSWLGLLTSRMRNMWSLLPGQGLSSSLDCPAVLILEYQSRRNESPTVFPWGRGPIYLQEVTCSFSSVRVIWYFLQAWATMHSWPALSNSSPMR